LPDNLDLLLLARYSVLMDVVSDRQVLEELGRRMARTRLEQNITQDALAREAGVSVETLRRIESGRSSNTTNLVRVLRALGALDLDRLIPEPLPSPIERLKSQGKQRRRAS
jgi:transcriptional regulator with XRE-family HTH domain